MTAKRASGGVRLAAFDMEGCLTRDPTVWEIMHRKLGTWESRGLPYWTRYLAGEIGYDEFARMDVAAWAGAPEAMLAESAGEVQLMPGCGRLLSALREAGVQIAVVSNGLACVAERFRAEFGAQHVYANVEGRRAGALTGELDIRVPYRAKGEVLRDLAARLGIGPDETAAVGDSPADVAMFRQARVSVAFRPSHPSVAQAARHVVQDGTLEALCDLLLG